jgi:hypothetical protein
VRSPSSRAVLTHGEGEEDLIIRNWDWELTIVPFQDCYACVRTLGVNVNLAGTWGQQVQEVSHKLARIASSCGATGLAVQLFIFSKLPELIDTGVKAIRMAVQKGVLYQAAGSAWPLSDIQTIMMASVLRPRHPDGMKCPPRVRHHDNK